jgi:hypothetical protein
VLLPPCGAGGVVVPLGEPVLPGAGVPLPGPFGAPLPVVPGWEVLPPCGGVGVPVLPGWEVLPPGCGVPPALGCELRRFLRKPYPKPAVYPRPPAVAPKLPAEPAAFLKAPNVLSAGEKKPEPSPVTAPNFAAGPPRA